MRGLGTIEGLLLMVDWHARSLHLPPDIEAWDSDDDNLQESELNGFSEIFLKFSLIVEPCLFLFQFPIDGCRV